MNTIQNSHAAIQLEFALDILSAHPQQAPVSDALGTSTILQRQSSFDSVPETPSSNFAAPAQPKASKKAKILVAGDVPVVTLALDNTINSQPDLAVCGRCRASETVSSLECFNADAVVLNMTDPAHLDVVKALVRKQPDLPILVYSMLDQRVFPELAIRAKARGYVSKQQPLGDLPIALRKILSGLWAVNDDLQRHINAKYLGLRPLELHDKLSCREVQVFYYLGQAKGTVQIAKHLGLSIKTIESFRDQLKNKLNVTMAPQLVREAVKWVEALEN